MYVHTLSYLIDRLLNNSPDSQLLTSWSIYSIIKLVVNMNDRYTMPVFHLFFFTCALFILSLSWVYIADIPRATLRPGRSLDLSAIEEGDDVYFECTVDSSPAVYKIIWVHQVGNLPSIFFIAYVLIRISHFCCHSIIPCNSLFSFWVRF